MTDQRSGNIEHRLSKKAVILAVTAVVVARPKRVH